MQLANSHDNKRQRQESEQRREQTEDDVDAMDLRRRHRVGNISSNEKKLSNRRRERGSLRLKVF
jgi:hypothetical protein